jgi:uncharacterized protein (TIGR02594 family)
VNITPYQLATRFDGLRETPGLVHNAAIVAMLQLVDRNVADDETAWCSAFVHYVTWLLDTPRSRSLRARSWLTVGKPVSLFEAEPGWDVVVLTRGANAPPASVLQAPGHVGFFVAQFGNPLQVRVLGGNQSNRVSVEEFPAARVLGVRRLL